MFIYVVTNDVNEKAYVGLYSGANLKIRWRRHVAAARGESRLALHRAMRKHGVEKFHITSIWSGHVKIGELGELERYFIRVLRTKGPSGYNSSDGGMVNAGFRHTEETLAKLRGKVVSAETKAKMKANHVKKLTLEHKAKIGAALKGNQHLLGNVPSEETRQKLSIASHRYWDRRQSGV